MSHRHRWRLHGPHDARPTRDDLALAKGIVPRALRSSAWAVCLRCGAQRIAVDYQSARTERVVAVDVRAGDVVKECAAAREKTKKKKEK